jgi:hypothetical protein
MVIVLQSYFTHSVTFGDYWQPQVVSRAAVTGS